MATLIFFMRCGRGTQQFARTGCGNGVEYTYLRASCQIKKLLGMMALAEQAFRDQDGGWDQVPAPALAVGCL
jgi:hypothetical protein